MPTIQPKTAGAPYGLTDTHKEQLNADLLSFVRR
jgi:hypothetical protein